MELKPNQAVTEMPALAPEPSAVAVIEVLPAIAQKPKVAEIAKSATEAAVKKPASAWLQFTDLEAPSLQPPKLELAGFLQPSTRSPSPDSFVRCPSHWISSSCLLSACS
jgi:hypothetical protein